MALRDVVSYLITAQDQTRAATQSARRNLEGLRDGFAGIQRSMRAIGAATAGFLTFQGLKAGIGSIIETRVEFDRMRNTLAQGVGAQNVAGELLFLRKAADDFGQSFQDISAAYARFAAASRGTAIEGEATRDVFLAVTKASTVLGLSADQTSGALNAIQQMISKGTVQAEELRGQLGERLPGAFQTAARAMGVTTQELSKMLEQGQLLADDFLPKFAAQLEREFAGGLENASKSAQGSINRLSNAWEDLKRITSEGFIGQGAFASIDLLSKYLNSLNDDLNAVRLGMLSFLGTSRSALSAPDVSALAGPLRRDPGSLGEARLRREGGTDPTGALAAAAAEKQREAALQRSRAAWDALLVKHRTAEQKQADIAAEIRKTGQAAGKSETEIRRLIAAAAGPAKKPDLSINRAKLQADFAAIRTSFTDVSAFIQNAESVLEANRAAGLLGDREYYGEKIRLANLAADAQIHALERENDHRSRQKLTGVDAIRNQQEIAENQAEIVRIQESAAAQVTVLSIQQAAGARRVSRAFEEARASAEAYLASLERAHQRDLESIGMGESERRRQSGRSQIEDRYSSQRLQLESERRSGAFDAMPGEFKRQMDLINEFQQKALASWDRYYAELKAKEQDGALGAQEAIANYIDESRNSFRQVEGAATNAFRGLEDVVVDFARTGKLSFSSFADSIIADVSRIAAQRFFGMLLNTIFGGASRFTGVGFGSQNDFVPQAEGTNFVPYDGFKASLHRGEAVVPAKYNPAAGGVGGGTTIIQHNHFNGTQVGNADPNRLARMVREVAVAGVEEQRRRSGS